MPLSRVKRGVEKKLTTTEPESSSCSNKMALTVCREDQFIFLRRRRAK